MLESISSRYTLMKNTASLKANYALISEITNVIVDRQFCLTGSHGNGFNQQVPYIRKQSRVSHFSF